LEIAFESGFNSKSAFNNVFKRFTNKTPTDYISATSESHIAKAAKQYTYFIRQGIGWQIFKGRGGLMLQHGGGGLGFITTGECDIF
jgi:Bacterial regulatory helix-turn-helix proteins, AraC family